MAGRRARISRSRPSDASLNRDTRPRLRIDGRNSLNCVRQTERSPAQLVRKLDRRGRARREIARQIEPSIICDDVISRLTVRACLQSRVAAVADREGAGVTADHLEMWEQRERIRDES